jgi:hypothetical protein
MMKTIHKQVLLILLAAGTCVLRAAADEKPRKPLYPDADIRELRSARAAYLAGDYGNALKSAESAKIERKKLISWQLYTLQNSLKSSEVKKAGNSLSLMMPIMEKRQEYDAIDIIKRYEIKMTPGYFADSAEQLTGFIQKRNSFPEADWIIGDVYRCEGEYVQAKDYLLSAWNNAFLLNVPEEQYDILYSLADIAGIENDTEGYETDLLLILADDKFFKNSILNDAMLLTIRNQKAGAMEKFFTYFRSEDYRSIAAYFKLADFYTASSPDKALKACALGVLTGFTKMYETVMLRDSEYEYTGLSSLLREITRYPDILDWADKNDIWNGFIDFAGKTAAEGDSTFARDLYTALAADAPDQYFREQAARALKKTAQ